MKIQVLGSGCPTCKKLYDLAQKASKEIGGGCKVEYVTGAEGMRRIIELGAMGSPVLSVDGKMAMVGFSPDMARIKAAILKTATAGKQ